VVLLQHKGSDLSIFTAIYSYFKTALNFSKRVFMRQTNRAMAQVTVALSLVSALVTFLTLTGYTPIVPTHNVVLTTFVVNAMLIVFMLIMIAKELWGLLKARKQGSLASKLHIRIVRLFVFVASAPVILVAIAASITLDRGISQLVNNTVQSTIASSVNVANSYIDEQVQRLRAEVSAMAGELDNGRYFFIGNTEEYERILTANVQFRGFIAGHVVDDKAEVIAKAKTPDAVNFKPPPLVTVTELGQSDDLFVFSTNQHEAEYLEALVRLREQPGKYLHVVRVLNPVISRHARLTREGALNFRILQDRLFSVKLTFALMFALMALIVTFSAIWVGLAFANRLISPIKRLMVAANSVAGGDLDVRVPVIQEEGDLATLGMTFNNMTEGLKSQRKDLLEAKSVIDQRARFTEAVLDGVSAGVIGLDARGRVTLINPRAIDLLGESAEMIIGQRLAENTPELEALLLETEQPEKTFVQGNITLLRGGRERNLHVQLTAEAGTPEDHGTVVTLDDVTDLVAAQRNSAWADVARRIAHEIKNPLTPIQLSAERLKRRFGDKIIEGKEVFTQCTDTIIRQVGDIGRMVDEFSSFARMPKPDFEAGNINDVVKEAVFLASVGFPDVKFSRELTKDNILEAFDRRLISQALTNILKNAAESVMAVEEPGHKGKVNVTLTSENEMLHLDVEDNGIGLPNENRNRLLEPYVTTRVKGTGLGLAIVGRIMEDHGGKLTLLDADHGRGAKIRLSFPLNLPVKGQE
jgi:two-component system, NtrC family, nitrogen regulation sensor histidine kinase NtrY